MRFFKSCVPILAAGLLVSAAASAPVAAFSMKGQDESEAITDVNNKEFERAALLEARAYLCGTNEASDSAMRAGMAQTGLPEDIAVEIVSDLASGIVDKAVKSKSQEICGKAKVQLSRF